MVSVPNTVPELIDALGGPSAVGRIIGKRPSTASEMKRNASIAVDHWPAFIAAAAALGMPLTAQSLLAMHTQGQAKGPPDLASPQPAPLPSSRSTEVAPVPSAE